MTKRINPTGRANGTKSVNPTGRKFEHYSELTDDERDFFRTRVMLDAGDRNYRAKKQHHTGPLLTTNQALDYLYYEHCVRAHMQLMEPMKKTEALPLIRQYCHDNGVSILKYAKDMRKLTKAIKKSIEEGAAIDDANMLAHQRLCVEACGYLGGHPKAPYHPSLGALWRARMPSPPSRLKSLIYRSRV